MSMQQVVACCCDVEPFESCPDFPECDEVANSCQYTSIQAIVSASGTVVTNFGEYTWTLVPQDDSPGDACIIEYRFNDVGCAWTYSSGFPGRFDLSFTGTGPLNGQTFQVSGDPFRRAYFCNDTDENNDPAPRTSRFFARYERGIFSSTRVAFRVDGPYVPCPGDSVFTTLIDGAVNVDEFGPLGFEFDESSTVDSFSVTWA